MNRVNRDNRKKETVKGERGAAMILVLTVIFVLSSLGSIALLSSLSNTRMGTAAATWTKDFYSLDSLAERALEKVDASLVEAERLTSVYMRDELYRYAGGGRVADDAAAALGADEQNYVYNRWSAEVWEPALLDAGDAKQEPETGAESTDAVRGAEPAEAAMTAAPTSVATDMESTVAAPEAGSTSAAPEAVLSDAGTSDRSPDASSVDTERYDSLFARFHEEFFARIFFNYAVSILRKMGEELSGTGMTITVFTTPDMSRFLGMRDADMPEEGAMTVTIDAADAALGGAPGKSVRATLSVATPRFGAQTVTENIPFRANPAWTNAVTAKGSVFFAGGTSEIFGDLVAQDYNEYYPSSNDFASLEGNRNGIVINSASATVYGNAYTRGDLHVVGDGGEMTVRRYAGDMPREYKIGAYGGNTLYFDTTAMPASVQRYVQLEDTPWTRGFIPLFYRDSLGGNVYCNNLAIEEGVSGGRISTYNGADARLGAGMGSSAAAGVVQTLDDVENDGESSTIEIMGNLIGLSSETAFTDHMSSSAVINGAPESSTIRLGGAAIVPGTAFMRFDGVNDHVGEITYFETGESVSATTPQIVRAYVEASPTLDPGSYFYDSFLLSTPKGMSHFFLAHYEIMTEKVRHLIGNLAGRPVATGVVVPGEFEGYARGAVLAENETGVPVMFAAPGISDGMPAIEGFDDIKNYSQNYMAYSEMRDSLKAAFRLKTESFGFSGRALEDMVDSGVVEDAYGRPKAGLPETFFYIKGGGEFVVDGDITGIVYCAAAGKYDGELPNTAETGGDGEGGEGDVDDNVLPSLRITGDGEFRGTVICEGDIVIDADVSVVYDEKVISRILLQNPEVRAFFAPGETGETAHVRLLRVSQSQSRLNKERYAITSWLERQE